MMRADLVGEQHGSHAKPQPETDENVFEAMQVGATDTRPEHTFRLNVIPLPNQIRRTAGRYPIYVQYTFLPYIGIYDAYAVHRHHPLKQRNHMRLIDTSCYDTVSHAHAYRTPPSNLRYQ